MSVTDGLDTRSKTSHPARAATRLWRDLAGDWRRWTAIERILAAGLLVVSVASVAAIIHMTA